MQFFDWNYLSISVTRYASASAAFVQPNMQETNSSDAQGAFGHFGILAPLSIDRPGGAQRDSIRSPRDSSVRTPINVTIVVRQGMVRRRIVHHMLSGHALP
jgi:hypothetical protein